jgi:hypothetical protein
LYALEVLFSMEAVLKMGLQFWMVNQCSLIIVVYIGKIVDSLIVIAVTVLNLLQSVRVEEY